MKTSVNFTMLLVTLFLGCAGTPESESSGLQPEAVETEDLRLSLLGAWGFAGRPGEVYEPEPGGQVKFWGLRHWAVTQWDPETGEVRFHHGGTYTLDGDKYVERVTFAGENIADMIGEEYRFTITVEGDTFTQIGDGNDYNEVWKRFGR